jgi:prefoldin beta subunit
MAISNEDYQAFSQYNAQLSSINTQKTQMRMLIETTKNAIEEMKESKEETAYKNLGFVMLKVDKAKLIKDLQSEIETLNIRIKTLEKSEETISKKADELQAKFKAEMAKQNANKKE